ncbi:MAG: hypothetical protein RL462_1120 [Pseudomonadota bacterium]|jgi:hypothetical protein
MKVDICDLGQWFSSGAITAMAQVKKLTASPVERARGWAGFEMRVNGIKPFFLNSAIAALCAAPKIGWLCFVIMALVYVWAAFRHTHTKRDFLTGALAPVIATALYFSAYLFNKDTHDLDVYTMGAAVIQVVVAAAMVSVAHFTIWKPNREFIKAGV